MYDTKTHSDEDRIGSIHQLHLVRVSICVSTALEITEWKYANESFKISKSQHVNINMLA